MRRAPRFLPQHKTTCRGCCKMMQKSGQTAFCRLVSYLNLGSCVVTTPTSSSEGLKSMERTVERQEIAVCWGRGALVRDKSLHLKTMLIKSEAARRVSVLLPRSVCLFVFCTSTVCSKVQSSFFFTFFSRKLVASVCFTPAAVALKPQ